MQGGFCDIQNNQGLGRGYPLKPKAEVGNPYRDLDYSTKTESNVYYTLNKKNVMFLFLN